MEWAVTMNKDIETGVPESKWHVLGRQIIELPYEHSRISFKNKQTNKNPKNYKVEREIQCLYNLEANGGTTKVL